MDEMYSTMPGSPITYLVGDISAGQTTIAIADDTALPDAPNICTIGYGEHVETIRYGAKSNGVLQQVTRGIEGTPRAWPSGTEVARFYTAYDHNALIEKVTENATNHATHLAESATQFDRLQHYNAPQPVLYESGDNRWRDIVGVGLYYAGTASVGYPQATGILIHFKLSVTTITWQMFIGNSGQIWTRRVGAANFADVEWVAV